MLTHSHLTPTWLNSKSHCSHMHFITWWEANTLRNWQFHTLTSTQWLCLLSSIDTWAQRQIIVGKKHTVICQCVFLRKVPDSLAATQAVCYWKVWRVVLNLSHSSVRAKTAHTAFQAAPPSRIRAQTRRLCLHKCFAYAHTGRGLNLCSGAVKTPPH